MHRTSPLPPSPKGRIAWDSSELFHDMNYSIVWPHKRVTHPPRFKKLRVHDCTFHRATDFIYEKIRTGFSTANPEQGLIKNMCKIHIVSSDWHSGTNGKTSTYCYGHQFCKRCEIYRDKTCTGHAGTKRAGDIQGQNVQLCFSIPNT